MSLETVVVIAVLVGFGAFLYLRKKKADANRGSDGNGLPKEKDDESQKLK